MSKRLFPCHFCKRVNVDASVYGFHRPWSDTDIQKVAILWCEECRAREETLGEALERKFHRGYTDLKDVVPSFECLEILGEEWIRNNRVVPMEIDTRTGGGFSTIWLSVAMVNPFDIEAQNYVSSIWRAGGGSARAPVVFFVCDELSFDQFLQRAYPKENEEIKKTIDFTEELGF